MLTIFTEEITVEIENIEDKFDFPFLQSLQFGILLFYERFKYFIIHFK